MNTIFFVIVMFLAISQFFICLFLIRLRKNLKLLLKKLSTYFEFQDSYIDSIVCRLNTISQRLDSLFSEINHGH